MITDTFKVFKEQVESSFPNYMVDYSATKSRGLLIPAKAVRIKRIISTELALNFIL